jgi:hypothetical protein
MNDHAFYFGLMVVAIVGLATFAPENTITGFTIGECPDCGKLCSDSRECNGLICCPTAWESGVCHKSESCPAIAELSSRQSYEEYVNPQTPQSLENVAWKTFGFPVLVILALVAAVVFFTRRNH